MENIQQLIKEVREKKGMTQKQLAEASHIQQHTLSQYETGKRQLSMVMFEALMGVMGFKINIQLEEITMENSEMKLKSALVAQELFQAWGSVEERLPEYKVEHTGGGVFIASKNFSTRDGRVVGVWLSKEVVFLYKKLEEVEEDGEVYSEVVEDTFIKVDEYTDELLEHGGEVEVVLASYGENGVEEKEIMRTYLEQDDIDEILEAVAKL